MKRIRECGDAAELTVYEPHIGAVNPMLTTYYAAGRIPRDQMQPFGSMETLQARYGFRIVRSPVVRAGGEARRIITADGTEEAFDKILLAAGARAFVPPIGGAERHAQRMFTMRTYTDALRLRERLARGGVRRAVVAGASMVGIKVAELLHEQGAEVVIADLAGHIFPTAARREAAEEIQRRLEEKGIRLLWNAAVQELDENGVGLSTGARETCDILCMCVGTRANTALADGLRVNRGILVDERMRTSAEGVYACGDCCEGPSLLDGGTAVIGLWANAAAQGKAAGENMAGGDTVFSGGVPCNITHFMGMDFIGVGNPGSAGEILRIGSPARDDFVEFAEDTGPESLLNILGSCLTSGILKNRIISRQSRPEKPPTVFQQAALLARDRRKEILTISGGAHGHE